MVDPFQVPDVIVATPVKLEVTTLLAKDVPVKVFAAAAIVISPEPSKLTPLIAREVASFVAVLALPVNGPAKPPVLEIVPVVLNVPEIVVLPTILVDPPTSKV